MSFEESVSPDDAHSRDVIIRKQFYKGDTIFEKGAPSHNAYYIEEGKVEIFVSEGNHRLSLAMLEKGEIFGEMGLINPGPRSASVKAVEDCVLMVISQHEMDNKLNQIPNKAVRALLNILITRLRQANITQFEHSKNLKDFRAKMMGIVDTAADGINEKNLELFHKEVTPHIEKIEELLAKYK